MAESMLAGLIIPKNRQPRSWRKLGRNTREALLEWFNVKADRVTVEDLEQLADLRNSGRFRYWHCPSCQDLVMEGSPEDWGTFSGANQNDRASYPGRSERDKRCDFCRCHNR
jgi:hypothetical protein